MSHSVLVDVVEAFLWKVHHYGAASIDASDIRDLDEAMAMEKARHDETEDAVHEFVEAMNSPRGDAADRRRSASLKRLREAKRQIEEGRRANAGRLRIESERAFPQ